MLDIFIQKAGQHLCVKQALSGRKGFAWEISVPAGQIVLRCQQDFLIGGERYQRPCLREGKPAQICDLCLLCVLGTAHRLGYKKDHILNHTGFGIVCHYLPEIGVDFCLETGLLKDFPLGSLDYWCSPGVPRQITAPQDFSSAAL